MADNTRKKQRGRKKPKLNLRSCFPSFASNERQNYSSSNYHNRSNDQSSNRDSRFGEKLITVSSGCNKTDLIPDVEDVNEIDRVNNDHSSHRRRISRLFKPVFDSFMAKKKIDRSSSKSSATLDTSEASSSLSSEKTMKSLNNNSAIRVSQSTDLDSSLGSRTTSSSNLSLSCCSSSNSNSQWSSEPKTTSSRIDLVDFKPNPNPNPNPSPISSTNSTLRSDSLPKPNKTISSKNLVSSNSLPLPNHNHNHNHNRNQIKIKSTATNRNNVLWCLFILLSLVVLVVYGRIYSILCTSTWFYFVPCRKMKRVNSESSNSVKVVDTDSEQYKKRVIMAGLLDRTRNPLR